MLSQKQIKELGLVSGGTTKSEKPSSYDLTIGTILTAEGKEAGQEVTLAAHGGMAELISAEFVRLPANVCGLVSIKTALSDKVVLAINIGVIDPGYAGPIGTTVINFGKTSCALTKGEAFLRVTFHEVSDAVAVELTKEDPVVLREDYVRRKRGKAETRLTDAFLDIKKTAEQVSKDTFDRTVKVVGAALVLLSIVSFILNWIAPRSPSYLDETIRSVVREELRKAPATAAPIGSGSAGTADGG